MTTKSGLLFCFLLLPFFSHSQRFCAEASAFALNRSAGTHDNEDNYAYSGYHFALGSFITTRTKIFAGDIKYIDRHVSSIERSYGISHNYQESWIYKNRELAAGLRMQTVPRKKYGISFLAGIDYAITVDQEFVHTIRGSIPVSPYTLNISENGGSRWLYSGVRFHIGTGLLPAINKDQRLGIYVVFSPGSTSNVTSSEFGLRVQYFFHRMQELPAVE